MKNKSQGGSIMKVTVIGKPKDFIKQSRPEDVLKFASPEKESNSKTNSRLETMEGVEFEIEER